MFTLNYTSKFRKDLKLIRKRSIEDFELVSNFLVNELSEKGFAGLDKKFKTHKLIGNYKGNWECHIKPDLLIIWFEVTIDNEIDLVRIGSHADIF